MNKNVLILILVMILISLFSILFYNVNNFQFNDPPPSLRDGIRVYISSPLFNMSNLFYAVGINGLQSTMKGGVTSDNIKSSDMNTLANILQTTMGIPRGGIAEAIAKRGWQAYIPARDGFNMSILVNATLQYFNIYLTANNSKSKKLKSYGLVKEDYAFIGSYLLMAVYAFDMYNLINRCNCFLINTGGLTMDDGSIIELGLANARGLPIAIHAPEDSTLFAGGIINPMVAGSASINLSVKKWKFFNINDALNHLEKLINKQIYSGKKEYYRTAPIPQNIKFWTTLGRKIWNMRFKGKNGQVVDSFGVTNQVLSYTNLYRLNNTNEAGSGYIGSITIGLVKQTLKQFKLPILQN